ncbi:MAG TPA: dihydrofolate reductase [Bacteroidia bacterium]|nr:dihydrofolate reductase [Bacteroidia bacterium]
MQISLIAAVSENNVIGKDKHLPWHLPADMKYFRETTMGHCVIMGRRNYDSIPEKFRPLPGRTNIIVTHQKKFSAPDCVVVNSIVAALNEAEKKNETETFIIGGGEIFKEVMNTADKIYLTRIHHTFEGDVFFPELNTEEWKEESSEHFKADEKNKFDYSFLIYIRKK